MVTRYRSRALLFILLALAWSVARASHDAGVRFRTLVDGSEEARATGRPILLFFTAAWCTPCSDLKFSVFSLGVVAKLIEEKYVPIEVVDRRREEGANSPEVEALMSRIGVHSFPTLVISHVGGAAAVRQTGFASRESTLSFLREGATRLEAAEAKARKAGPRATP